MVNGLYGLSGERSKAARAAKLGIPAGTPAGRDYVNSVWLPAQQAAASAAAQTGNTPTGDGGGGFLDTLPTKLFGQPTWMLMVGGAIFVMYFFKGSSKGRR